MAFGTDHITANEVPNFIPELWSDEVVAAYKSNLVYANLVRTLNMVGKKGDTVRVPTPTRGAAASRAMTSSAIVTLQAHGTDAGVSILIDKHYEYSRLIDDVVTVQALESLRRFYTDDGGYAIAKAVDTTLIFAIIAADYTVATVTANVIQDDGSITGVIFEGDGTTWDDAGATDLTDAGIREFIKLLDDADAPMAGRSLVVPTIVKKDLLGIARFTEQAFVGEAGSSNTIRNGLIGNVYGSEVYVSTNLPTIDESSGTPIHNIGQYFQKDAVVLVEQTGVRAQNQYKQEYLADLMTVDKIWGAKCVRATSVINFVIPST